MSLADLPDAIADAREAEPLARLVMDLVPESRSLDSLQPLSLAVWWERMEESQRANLDAEVRMAKTAIVTLYPLALNALRQRLVDESTTAAAAPASDSAPDVAPRAEADAKIALLHRLGESSPSMRALVARAVDLERLRPEPGADTGPFLVAYAAFLESARSLENAELRDAAHDEAVQAFIAEVSAAGNRNTRTPSASPDEGALGRPATVVPAVGVPGNDAGDDAALKYHPFANIFPLLVGPEFNAMVESIREKGLLEDIIKLDGKILDGRNRARACRVAGVEPTYSDYTGDDPLGFVLAKNVTRRQLTTSQRADAAAQAMQYHEVDAQTRMKAGKKASNPPADLPEGMGSREQAAALMSVSPRLVQDAHTVRYGSKRQTPAEPEVVAAMQAGTLPVSKAVKLGRETPAVQQKVAKAVSAGKKYRAVMAEVKEPKPGLAKTAPLSNYALTQRELVAEHRAEMMQLQKKLQASAASWATNDPIV
jgi:hypothetical protein